MFYFAQIYQSGINVIFSYMGEIFVGDMCEFTYSTLSYFPTASALSTLAIRQKKGMKLTMAKERSKEHFIKTKKETYIKQ